MSYFTKLVWIVLDIPWPEEEEELSANSRNAIDILLTMDMTKRAGLKGQKFNQLTLFNSVKWVKLYFN